MYEVKKQITRQLNLIGKAMTADTKVQITALLVGQSVILAALDTLIEEKLNAK